MSREDRHQPNPLFYSVPDSQLNSLSMPENPAISLLTEGLLDEALAAATSELNLWRQEVADDETQWPQVFSALLVLGDVQREMSDASGAEASYHEALDIAGKHPISQALTARTRTQRFGFMFKRRRARPDTSNTAAAPSPRGQHCCTVRSPATLGDAKTCSSDRGLRNCA